MKFAAGVDGGGTKTILEVLSLDQEYRVRKFYGPMNINSSGEESVLCLLDQIFYDIVQIGTCEALCIGTAGISNPAAASAIQRKAGQYGLLKHLILTGDEVTALRGALGTRAGLVVIAGTGSICYGQNTSGDTARSGGYGHLMDDGGSGFAIARDALSAIVKSLDGRSKPTLLKELFFDFLQVSTEQELLRRLYDPRMNKQKIAALAPLVSVAAQKADTAALDILDRNIHQLVELAKAVTNRLQLHQAKCSLLGGVFANCSYMRIGMEAELKRCIQQLTCVAPLSDAASGAVEIAYERYLKEET